MKSNEGITVNHDIIKSVGVLYALAAAVIGAVVWASDSANKAVDAKDKSTQNEKQIVEVKLKMVEVEGKIDSINLKTDFILQALSRIEEKKK